MTYQTQVAKSRNEIRSEITNHPKWPVIRNRDNLRSDALDADTIRRLMAELNISSFKDASPAQPIPNDDGLSVDPLPSQPSPEIKNQVIKVIEEAQPKPQPLNKPKPNGLTSAIFDIIDAYLEERNISSSIDEQRVREIAQECAKNTTPHVSLTVTTPSLTFSQDAALIHHKFPYVLTAIAQNLPVLLVGPAGSGKTTLAKQISTTLELPFHMTGAVGNEFKLSGFKTGGTGEYVETEFYRAFVNGGLFLFDEFDASNANAILFANAAAANDFAEFPTGTEQRHSSFRLLASANTYGTGQSRIYNARNQQDGAALDRYVVITFPYDLALEAALIGQPRPDNAPLPPSFKPRDPDSVAVHMQAAYPRIVNLRHAAEALDLRHIISPRATVAYAKLYAAGWPVNDIADSVIFKGLDKDTRAKLLSKAGE